MVLNQLVADSTPVRVTYAIYCSDFSLTDLFRARRTAHSTKR